LDYIVSLQGWASILFLIFSRRCLKIEEEILDDIIPSPNLEDARTTSAYEQQPISQSASWTKYILEFGLPGDLEDLLIKHTKPLIDLAAKTNILRTEVTLHLMEYDLIWERYKIFMHKGKFNSQMYVVKELLRHAFELQLCRSVEGFQSNLLFTSKHEYLVRNEKEDRRKKRFEFFRGKPQEGDERNVG